MELLVDTFTHSISDINALLLKQISKIYYFIRPPSQNVLRFKTAPKWVCVYVILESQNCDPLWSHGVKCFL